MATATDPIGTRPPLRLFQVDRLHYRTTTPYTIALGFQLKVAFVTHAVTAESGDEQTILSDTGSVVSEVSGSAGTWDVDLDSSGATTPSTQAWQRGHYHWQEYVEKSSSGERHTLREGTLELRQSLQSGGLSSGGDFRTWARIALVNIEAVIQAKATKDQRSYQIANRSLERYSTTELMEFRAHLQSLVDREDACEALRNDGALETGSYLVEF